MLGVPLLSFVKKKNKWFKVLFVKTDDALVLSTGEYMLLCKGAEIAILDRIVKGDVLETQNLINEYAVVVDFL